MESQWKYDHDDEINQKIDVGVSIRDTCKGDHFIRFLIVGDEDDISDVDKEDEIADEDVDLLWKEEGFDGNVEGHDDEGEEHLIE